MGRGTATVGRLRKVIRDLYGCDSVHVASVPMHESVEGHGVWDHIVEVFSLIDHPKAEAVYAWCCDPRQRCYATVLAVGPIVTPLDAVRADIAADLRTKRGQALKRTVL